MPSDAGNIEANQSLGGFVKQMAAGLPARPTAWLASTAC